jgi:NADH:ubiquinone oxidoreductase subunit 3 (subunit A)
MRGVPGKSVAVMASDVSAHGNRDFLQVLGAWLLLALTLMILALPNASVPGLYYDEAQCAGLARDFLTGHTHAHLPGTMVISIFGRPFPAFVQNYGGAIKSWLLLPSFAVFGASQAVLRLTALGWALVALLLFMLWIWRWLGKNTALLAGALLALDPIFFFANVLDWGLVFPSFLCRFACFYFALRWRQLRTNPPMPQEQVPGAKVEARGLCCAFLAGLFAGLGFFNKVDFAVLLGGVLLALLCCHARFFWEYFIWGRPPTGWPRRSRLAPSFALACLGFLLPAGPVLAHLPGILRLPLPGGQPDEPVEKFNTWLAMYNGSYFYRLIEAGGMFDKMYLTQLAVFAPLGVALLLAAAYLVGAERMRKLVQRPFSSGASFYRSPGDAAAFVLLAILFISMGVFLLPGAVRIHHMVLAYPFPHLAVALALTRLRDQSGSKLLPTLVALLLACELSALCSTQQFIRQTGGRGLWSNALSAFAREIQDRSDLTVASLDWGFNEQLAFLTDGPKLKEPFWRQDPSVAGFTNCIYLAHPPQDRIFAFGELACLEAAQRSGLVWTDVRAWRDYQGYVAFYSFRLRAK